MSFLTIALAQLWHCLQHARRAQQILCNAVTSNRLVWYALARRLGLSAQVVTAPMSATAVQIQPIGVEGWALAIGCSLLPLAAGRL